ncbi:hypothetical protein Q9L58_008350 [Maublancomyces gigas]|uniref:Uncharacterized protein n=1 Tax=Discina gigas TaxID=1032678 RepID=A0ABR3G9Y1_9PEZI
MCRGLNDKQISSRLKVSLTLFEDYAFIDSIDEEGTGRLKITSKLLQDIFTTYKISSRFSGLLERQHMPGRIVQRDRRSKRPIHHQFWYSTVIRSNKAVKSTNSSKSILGWMRFCVWMGHDISNGVTTILALRCPEDIKSELALAFHDKGEMVKRNPMVLHAFFAQNVLLNAADFSKFSANPMYERELNEFGSTADFTGRSRLFHTLCRQITQVATDYKILSAALQLLKTEYEWARDHLCSPEAPDLGDTTSLLSEAPPELSDDIWDVFLAECELLTTYANLYETRTRIGINECFAMVSQRDSEMTIQMAGESTKIARVTYQDGQSLRAIQILTMVFLPASLCSGIFGMGFFDTSSDDGGNVNFSYGWVGGLWEMAGKAKDFGSGNG